MNASLVYDGKNLTIPESMGCPKRGQLTGMPLENLGELAGRVCYDSLGQGRTSVEYHEHILQVVNTSVYEHCQINLRIDMLKLGDPHHIMRACLNRKGLWVEYEDPYIEISANFRTILEWERHTKGVNKTQDGEWLGKLLTYHASRHAPMIFGIHDHPTQNLSRHIEEIPTEDLTDDQAVITLYLYGSRGFSHEQVRHRFAISQRSTRYVDEDGSPYIMHPLVTKFLEDPALANRIDWMVQVGSDDDENPTAITEQENIRQMIQESIGADRKTYRNLVRVLQRYCVEQLGMTDKTAARKQARGAARGFLGNALATDMLFTTSINGWKWILKNRKSKTADAEIREVYSPGLAALQSSQYGDRFAEFTLVPSPDGLGTVLSA